MSVECRFDERAQILWTTLRGDITSDELHQHMDVIDKAGWHQNCEIVDAREAQPQFTAKELPALATHGRRLFGQDGMAPRAVVVPKTNLITFGLTRLFASMADPWVTIRVFDNLPAAIAYAEAMTETREWVGGQTDA